MHREHGTRGLTPTCNGWVSKRVMQIQNYITLWLVRIHSFLYCMWLIYLLQEERLIEHYKRVLASEFEMTDIGLMHYFLGLEVWQEDGISSWARASMQETY